ncbi:MAG TPA: LytTR family DNA-binding domain-containing protein [Bacteroidia bacterium]|nr:LytTR family DNA-binding domain-containing protein [Bacteroidia bacterium]
MNCIIVDDNKMARTAVKEMIAQFDYLNIIAECENPIEAINIMKKEQIDLIFLDIEMPKMTGLQFLKSLEKRPLIILITAKPNYAVEAFEYNVVDYLVTPIKEERFIIAINRAQELFENSQNTVQIANKEFFFIHDNKALTKIKTSDILYIQANGDYASIHTFTKKYTVRLNLRVAQEKLPTEKFIRIHRSYIISIDKIDSMEENTVYINKIPIPVGDMYKSTFLKKLNLI